MQNKRFLSWAFILFTILGVSTGVYASEADIKIPDLTQVKFDGLGGVSGVTLMYFGILICAIGAVFGLVQYKQTKALPVHECMANVSNIIWETCKTYLLQQGKFLAILWVLIAACMVYYFVGCLQQVNTASGNVVVILLCSILGILGSYGVAWFGIRINTVANSRTAFSALKGNPLATLGIPLRSGMSVGLLLVCVELFFMICILVFLPRELVGPCFIGFAIGESLGASRAPHLRRHLHQDRRHRLRPDEDRLQAARRRPEEPRRDRRLHRRQRRRLGRPDGGRLRDLRRDRRGADRVPRPGAGGQPGHLRDAHHLALRHARPDDRDLAGVLLRQRSHQQGHVRRQEGLRLRSPADPPGVDHLGGVHRRHLHRQQAAAGRLQDADGKPSPTCGGCSRSSSVAARWPAR